MHRAQCIWCLAGRQGHVGWMHRDVGKDLALLISQLTGWRGRGLGCNMALLAGASESRRTGERRQALLRPA